jgi:predicted dehydrogenase
MSIGIGVLGFAHGHVSSYCTRWQAEPGMGVRVVCGWDHQPDRLADAAGKFDIPPAASADELLARPDVQGVVIGAETSLHAELVEKACEAGKAIALQKPIALTLDEADRIVAAVERAGVPFTMAGQMRIDPQNLRIKQMLDERALGQIFMVRRRHGLSFLLNEGAADSWHAQAKWNRDLWADDASHPIDLVYWLLGMPESVTAEIVTLHDENLPSDNGIAVYRYEGGPLAEVCCSFVNWAGENTTEVVGERGTIIQNYGDVPSCNVPRDPDAPGLKWYLHEEGKWTSAEIPTPPGHGERIAALSEPLARFFAGNARAIASAAEGRDALRMLLATYVSSRQGRRVTMDDPEIGNV